MNYFLARNMAALLITLWATATDLSKRRILNVQVIAMLISATVCWMGDGFRLAYLFSGIVTLVVLQLLARNFLGAGDIKLLSALGFMLGQQFIYVLMITFISAGIVGKFIFKNSFPLAPIILFSIAVSFVFLII